MASTHTPVPRQVGILVLDDDVSSQGALRHILDSEGGRVRIVPATKLLLAELKSGEWPLVIENVAMTGLESPLFFTLRELSSVSPEEGARLRVLYLVPEMTGSPYLGPLEF